VEGSSNARPSAAGRGTEGYRAPELMTEQPAYTDKVDIWAIGCIMYELVTGRKCFVNDVQIWNYYVGTNRLEPIQYPSIFEGQDVSPARLIGEALRRDPRQRPSARQLVRHFQDLRVVFDALPRMIVAGNAVPYKHYDSGPFNLR
jgi:serine/threonine protein kinase